MTNSTFIDVTDGCRAHGMPAAKVAAWWGRARQLDADVGMCICCFGPCPPLASGSLCKECAK